MGKIIDQIKPTGGDYSIISARPDNLAQRVSGVKKRLDNSNWKLLRTLDCEENVTLAFELVENRWTIHGSSMNIIQRLSMNHPEIIHRYSMNDSGTTLGSRLDKPWISHF